MLIFTISDILISKINQWQFADKSNVQIKFKNDGRDGLWGKFLVLCLLSN